MCDYSLEAYKSVKAEQGETYTVDRFPSGTIGITKSPGRPAASNPYYTSYADTCAVCLSEGTLLNLEFDGESKVGVFAKLALPSNSHKDGVIYSDGTEASFQALKSGTRITVLLVAGAGAPEDTDVASVDQPADLSSIHDLLIPGLRDVEEKYEQNLLS